MKPVLNKIAQATIATLPLLMTPILFYVLAEGKLNLGGGEKDIILVLPWLLWSTIFAICSYVFILKNYAILSWASYSFAISLSVMLVLFILLYITSFLGIS